MLNTIPKITQNYRIINKEIDENLIALFKIEKQSKSKSISKTKGKKVNTKPIEENLVHLALEMVNISTFLKNNGYLKEGENGLKKAIFLFKRFQKFPYAALALNNLAVHYQKINNLQEAFKYYQEAVNIYDSLETIDDLSKQANALHGYASVWYSLHHNDVEAKIYYIKALEIRKHLHDDPKYKLAKPYLALGQIYLEGDDIAEAESCFTSGLSILEINDSPDPNLKEILAIYLADVYQKQAADISTLAKTFSFDNAKKSLSNYDSYKRPEIETSLNNDFHPASFLNDYFKNESQEENNEAAIELLKKALSVLEPYLGTKSKQGLILQTIIRIMIEIRNYKEAESYARTSVELAKKQFNDELLKISLITLANALENLEKYEEALKVYEEATKVISSNTRIVFDFTNIAINSGRGYVFTKLSRYTEALACYKKALRFHEQHSGKNSVLIAETLVNLSSIYEVLDRFSEMQAACDRAVKIYESNGYLTRVADVVLNQGVLYDRREQYEEAEKCYLKAYNIYKEQQGEQSVEIAKILGNLGLMFYHKNDNATSRLYYEKSLKMIEALFPTDSPEKSRILSNYAILLIELHEFDEAERMLRRTLDILKKNSMYNSRVTTKALDALGSLFTYKQEIAKAKDFYEESLAIKRKIYPDDSSEIGETLSYIANLNSNDTDIESNYIEAITHYENSQQGNSFRTCEIRLNLARHYLRKGKSITDDVLRRDFFSKAQLLYNKLLEINRKLIKKSLDEFSEEDLSSHLSLLNEVTTLLCLNSQFDKAAELLEFEARCLSASYPKISFECIERSIYFYGKCLNTQSKRAELLALKLSYFKDLPLQMKPWPLIARTLQELQQLDTQSVYSNVIRNYNDLYSEFSEGIEDDIRFQFERCVEVFFEIKRLLLRENEKTTLDYTSNRVVELFISLRNILDQAYGRLLKRMLTEPYQKKVSEFYFPIRDSIESLQALLGKQQLLSSYIVVSTENLRIQNPNKTQFPDPPPTSEVLVFLKNAGLLKHVTKQVYQLVNFDPTLKDIPWRQEDLVQNPSLANYAAQILSKIKTLYKKCQHALDINCPDSYKAIVQTQPFSYFDAEKNKKKAGYWKKSWLEKLSVVNNDSKHFRLTPQERTVDLQKQEGMLKKAKRKFCIQYLEKRFYPWIFVEILPDSLTDVEKLKLSSDILDLLVSAGHIKNEKSSHLLARNYQASRIKGLSKQEQNSYRDAYHEEIKSLLLSLKANYDETIFEKIVMSVSNFLLRRTSHRSEIDFYEPDSSLDLNAFLKTVLDRVYHLISVFGKETARFQAASKKSTQSTSINVFRLPIINRSSAQLLKETEKFDDLKQVETKISDLLNEVEKFYTSHCALELLKSPELRVFYSNVDLLIQLLARHNKSKILVDLLLKAAKNFQQSFPILSIKYLKVANQVCKEANIDVRLQFESVDLLSRLYEHQNLVERANSILRRYIQEEIINSILIKRSQELEEHIDRGKENLDTDIFSQIEYLRDELFHLSCEIFDYYLSNPSLTSRTLQIKVKNRVYELLIKIRHLLDHGFRRLLISV